MKFFNSTLTKVFWTIQIFMIVLFILPTLMTITAPLTDGAVQFGFPLTFNSTGGLCSSSGCGFAFNYLNLLIDLLLVVGIPLLANFIFAKSKMK